MINLPFIKIPTNNITYVSSCEESNVKHPYDSDYVYFTTAAVLGPWLESLGIRFEGNGPNDLSKHYGQHIISRLVSGLLNANDVGVLGYSSTLGYGYIDFPKLVISNSMGTSGKVLFNLLVTSKWCRNNHAKPIKGFGENVYALDLFSVDAVKALLRSYGLTVDESRFVECIEAPAIGDYIFTNNQRTKSIPVSKIPSWANVATKVKVNTSKVAPTVDTLKKQEESSITTPFNVSIEDERKKLILETIDIIYNKLNLLKSLLSD